MKTSAINIMVSPEVKQKLKKKAEELGLNITSFIEKVSNEEVVFLDKNVKRVLKALDISM